MTHEDSTTPKEETKKVKDIKKTESQIHLTNDPEVVSMVDLLVKTIQRMFSSEEIYESAIRSVINSKQFQERSRDMNEIPQLAFEKCITKVISMLAVTAGSRMNATPFVFGEERNGYSFHQSGRGLSWVKIVPASKGLEANQHYTQITEFTRENGNKVPIIWDVTNTANIAEYYKYGTTSRLKQRVEPVKNFFDSENVIYVVVIDKYNKAFAPTNKNRRQFVNRGGIVAEASINYGKLTRSAQNLIQRRRTG